MNYNKTFVVNKEMGPTSAGTEMMLSFPNSFIVRKIWVVTRIAGVAATHMVKLQNAAGSTDYASITVGTTVANSLLSATVDTASQVFTAGTVLRIQTVNNESTGKYTLYIAGAHAE